MHQILHNIQWLNVTFIPCLQIKPFKCNSRTSTPARIHWRDQISGYVRPYRSVIAIAL